MTVKLLSFQPEHLDFMDYRGEKQEFVDLGKEGIAAQANMGLSFTLFADGQIVGCGGIVDMWPGVGEVWMLPSKHLEKYRRVSIQTVAGFLKMVDVSYHRIQASVRADHPAAVRFAEFFGFTMEGVMSAYDHLGNDYYRMARVRKWQS